MRRTLAPPLWKTFRSSPRVSTDMFLFITTLYYLFYKPHFVNFLNHRRPTYESCNVKTEMSYYDHESNSSQICVCFFCSSLHAVLHAMREDSEKVPSLLTDYILKGTPSVPVTKLLLPFNTPHITAHSPRYSINLRKHCSHSKQSFCLD